MGYFFALDAGGTRTECLLADDERVLARGVTGSVKLMSVGAMEATSRLRTLIENLSVEAGVPLKSITRTCMGLVGISSAGVRNWAEITLADLLPGDLVLMGDEEIALQAAFGDGPGVLVIAGTGSHVVGRCSNGTRMNAGGWGPMLGDEGSGHWIGVEAIRSGLRARDRGVPSCMLREISTFWQLESVDALIALSNQKPRPEFSALTGVVADCAARGDLLATSVLERAGEELGAQLSVVLSKMSAAGCAAEDLKRVAFTGSVLAKVPDVLRELRAAIHRNHPAVTVDDEPVDPIEGALARARRR